MLAWRTVDRDGLFLTGSEDSMLHSMNEIFRSRISSAVTEDRRRLRTSLDDGSWRHHEYGLVLACSSVTPCPMVRTVSM